MAVGFPQGAGDGPVRVPSPRIHHTNQGETTLMSESKRTHSFLGLLALSVTLAAPSAFAGDVDVTELWSKNCAICHGKDAKGETKSGKEKGVKDLTDAKIRAELKRDVAIRKVKEGIKDEKTGKDRMKPFGSKLTDEQIAALVDWAITVKP